MNATHVCWIEDGRVRCECGWSMPIREIEPHPYKRLNGEFVDIGRLLAVGDHRESAGVCFSCGGTCRFTDDDIGAVDIGREVYSMCGSCDGNPCRCEHPHPAGWWYRARVFQGPDLRDMDEYVYASMVHVQLRPVAA